MTIKPVYSDALCVGIKWDKSTSLLARKCLSKIDSFCHPQPIHKGLFGAYTRPSGHCGICSQHFVLYHTRNCDNKTIQHTRQPQLQLLVNSIYEICQVYDGSPDTLLWHLVHDKITRVWTTLTQNTPSRSHVFEPPLHRMHRAGLMCLSHSYTECIEQVSCVWATLTQNAPSRSHVFEPPLHRMHRAGLVCLSHPHMECIEQVSCVWATLT